MPKTYPQLLAERTRLAADPDRNAEAIQRVTRQMLAAHDEFYGIDNSEAARARRLGYGAHIAPKADSS